MPATQTPTHRSSGGVLVSADGRTLILKQTRLRADAGGGLARVRLEQTFSNPYDEPLAVTYQLPLPADGAVSAFAFQLGDRRIVGEVDKRAAARERYEQALVEGRSAALLEQDRSSLFTQEIGNVPPRGEITAEIDVDQPLVWIDGGQWEWRFPTAVAPRYLGKEGRVPDAGKVEIEVLDRTVPPRLDLALGIHDVLAGALPMSPSHPIAKQADGEETLVAFTSENGAHLDRDVVVRWPVATREVGVRLDTARGGEGGRTGDKAFGLLTIVPPLDGDGTALTRDVTILIDTSGSMAGEPLKQARRIVSALVDTLTERDHLEMIEFSMRPRRWTGRPVAMGAKRRKEALRWIAGLHAGGGTEMHSAVISALETLGKESQRQIVLVSDGLIGFETEIVQAVLQHMPAGSRFHTVGVGSAPNRSLTQAAARAGRGIEVIVGIGEDPAPAAQRLVARTTTPLIVDLELSGPALVACAPEKLPDLFGGAPARLAVELRPEGGELIVRGRRETGAFERRIAVAPTPPGAGRGELIALFGRERVEDLEMRAAVGQEVDDRIEGVGLEFQIATRLTSWVAVSIEKTVDPSAPLRRERIPQELPYGMSIEGLGLRSSGTFQLCSDLMSVAGADLLRQPVAPEARSPVRPKKRGRGGFLSSLCGGRLRDKAPSQGEDFACYPMMPPPMTEEGTGRRLEDGRLVIEFEWHDVHPQWQWPWEWELPVHVALTWSDGRVLDATVATEGSTATGAVPTGALVRLVIVLGENAPSGLPESVVFDVRQRPVTVQLS